MERTNMHMDDGRLGLYVTFITTVQSESFVDAAMKLDISASTLGRRIKRLESELKIQLFVRTTRSMNITEAGQQYFDALSNVLGQLESIEQALELDAGVPSGVLKVSIPNTFGRLQISPHIAEFLTCYPNITLDINQNDSFDDLMLKNLDVAIRIGNLPDSSLKAKMIAPNTRRLVASKSYLDKFGYPVTPQNLVNHRCLHFSPLLQGKKWTLMKEGKLVSIPITPIVSSDDASTLYDAVLKGVGIAQLADFIVQDDLAQRRLYEVLPDWILARSSIYAVYPSIGYLPLKTRVFIDFFTEKIRRNLD
ncbi:LysR family transcriptional regulator [Pseudoalteromonas sp. MMG013]|uniref:LysR family transcriptional regulator n=1 Tax=Pseudoalteromonas sp. MMG013 TaxID=2822687 RepID=UPI001B377310|nr:LysR family transcriptional regulator [Pseudoalteromonas sp. MMG013]MBQ4864207.1 LysR family transcriptional regulator [Pseudoalteromonas sp. MMG013]